MKKPNQIEKKASRRAGESQRLQDLPTAGPRDIMISRRRGDALFAIAAELGTSAREIGENAISSYLDFIDKFPGLAEAQPRFVRGEVVFAVLPTGTIYDRLDRACAVYNLDRDSVLDSAIGAYLDLVLRQDDGQSREFWLSCRGSLDAENIAYVLSRASENGRLMFTKLVNEISTKPFADACTQFGQLREMTMHHPGLRDEREALEMIVEGAGRLA